MASNVKTSRGLIPLKPLKGFPQDFRRPGLDISAYRFASERFGYKTLERIAQSYHRSEVSKELLFDDLKKYDLIYTSAHVRDDPIYSMVLASVKAEFQPSTKLIPLTLGACEKSPNYPKDRSPGIPWKMMGYKTKGEVLKDPEAVAKWHRKWRNIGRGRDETLPDVALFVRAQVTNIDRNKVRAVWGYPIDVISEEGRYFYPYLEWLKETDAPVGYCVEIARGGMAYIDEMLTAHPTANYLVNDWSEFDKTIPPWLIKDAFEIVYGSFDHTRVRCSEGKVWGVKEEDSLRRLKRVVKYFINTPVRTCDGTRFRKTGGVPSGSMWTNIIDTIVNIIVMRYITYHTTGSFPLAEMYLGDDSVCVISGNVDLDLNATLAKQYFGMNLNVRKTYVTRKKFNVHFIGYYDRDGKPYKSHDFLLASFIYPERRVENNTVRLARAVGQMWSTMDGGAAAHWHDICRDIMEVHGVTETEMRAHINAHPSYFKYLRTVGIDLGEVSIPDMGPERFIWRIEPPPYSIKKYKKKIWDYQAMWESLDSVGPEDFLYMSTLGKILRVN